MIAMVHTSLFRHKMAHTASIVVLMYVSMMKMERSLEMKRLH